ncbi:peptide synthetase [Pseudonocardia sp. AL041005-10]|nr:amino acid adenylation domain-containing protein [Pseudonocardia sp. AL041005-10]ALE77158.1 peptide synthetase [Pseudonocardia sp. AL041005-10]
MLRGEHVPLLSSPTVHARIAEHAQSFPETPAVVCGDAAISYSELDRAANRFAHWLRGRGVGVGSKIGVCLEYSVDLVIVVLGVLKSGAAYVPLDPGYPDARREELIRKVPDLRLVMVSEDTRGMVADVLTASLAELADELLNLPPTDPVVEVGGDDLCYAVFTSGSSGTPKLAGVRHAGWSNLLEWMRTEFGLHRRSHNVVASAFGFDLSQRSLLLPLFCGATQYLVASRNVDIAHTYRVLLEQDIRTLNCASSTLYLIIDWERARGGSSLTDLENIFIGGEPLRITRLIDWMRLPGNTCRILHQYGVAECTDVATSFDLSRYRPDEHEIVPVGRPIANVDVYVLDSALEPVADMSPGEICIEGAAVGAGYLDGSGSENERFVHTAVGGTVRTLYRTGDRGYVDRNGDLVVLGRMDAQVKVRGVRIDPVEIERFLCLLPGVQEAAVAVVAAPDESELVAFVVPGDGPIVLETLRSELAATLPRSMVPSRFVEIDRLPLSPHGKVDRAALAATSGS